MKKVNSINSRCGSHVGISKNATWIMYQLQKGFFEKSQSKKYTLHNEASLKKLEDYFDEFERLENRNQILK